ncbi:MAG: DUF4173 domain-containing protein [Streptosporangiales bacterium]|nr:DUF4173 domain-containing protein [Streptosporangiales bacterium]
MAGLLGAVAVPYERPGLGVVLTCLAIMAAALPAIRPRLAGPWPLAFTAVSALLLATCTLLDAPWVIAPCVALSALLASIAIADVTAGWAALTRGASAVLRALYPAAFFLARPLRGPARRIRLPAVLTGLGLTVAVLLVFVPLLASADAAFSRLIDGLWETDRLPELIGRGIVLLTIALITGAVALAGLRPHKEPGPEHHARTLDRTVWIPPLAALCLLFCAFIAVQAQALFGGERRILNTAGVTYAGAAREGFFQLIFVATLVLGVVALASWRVPREPRGDRVLLGWMLGLLHVLTLVLLASAAHRLYLYTEAFGLTRPRATAAGVAWWLAIVFVLLLVAGPARRRGWLPRAVAMVTGLALLSFAAVNPDARIADSQVIPGNRLTGADTIELGTLSADAVPALERLPEPTRSCVLGIVADELRDDDGWGGWNLSRERARSRLSDAGVTPTDVPYLSACPTPR